MSERSEVERRVRVARARQLADAGWSAREIADELGVSDSTVYGYLGRRGSHGPSQTYRMGPSARMRRLAAASARVRSRRAEIKARITVGELDVREVVIEPPIVLRTTPVLEIVACAPWIGKTRARALLRRAGVDERAVFGWTPPAKRWQLAAAIPKHKPVAGTRRVREKAAA